MVLATASQLKSLKAPYRILDPDATGGSFAIGTPRRAQARQTAKSLATVRHDDGKHLVLRVELAQADRLAEAGLDLQWLSAPLVLTEPKRHTAEAFAADAQVAAMIGEVDSAALGTLMKDLTGEQPATVGGTPYTIATRTTRSGTPIEMATQYAYETMTTQGLATSYDQWTVTGSSGRNVVATKTGSRRPEEIVLVTAHLDDMPNSGPAPGADDNATGASAVLTAAGICAGRNFQRTIRFVLFTGEEQGLLGSEKYAFAAYQSGENIVAVLNMDMIGWDQAGGPTLVVHTPTADNLGYAADLEIAELLPSVVSAYGLGGGLVPVIASDSEVASDHASFWKYGFAGVLLSEDYANDSTPYYHTSSDAFSTLNMDYFENAVKAAVGMTAHLAILSDSNAAVRESRWMYLEDLEGAKHAPEAASAIGSRR